MFPFKIVGVDLAAKAENPTGFCFFENNFFLLKTLFSDDDIMKEVLVSNPDLVAIDAPIVKKEVKGVREADRALKRYGAMSLDLPSMQELMRRGTKIAEFLGKRGYDVIEVFPTATAKILGFYERDYRRSVRHLDVKLSFKNKHEYDAYLCCLTGKMHCLGETVQVGDENGRIVIPCEVKKNR